MSSLRDVHKKEFSRLMTIVDNAYCIAICWHASPDGDCLWSCIAFWRYIQHIYNTKDTTITIHYYTPDSPSDVFDIFEESVQFKTHSLDPSKYDCIISLDTANQERTSLSPLSLWSIKTPVFIIDHHVSNSFNLDWNQWAILVDPDVSSCAELLTNLLLSHDSESIDEPVATPLLMWILTDTGNFMRWDNLESSFATAWKLMKWWANKDLLTHTLFRKKSFEAVRYIWTILSRIRYFNDSIIYSRQSNLELEEFGIDSACVESWLFTMTSIEHDWVFIMFKVHYSEDWNRLKCSLRTKNKSISVSDIAAEFWWWWHHAAAWAKVSLQWTPQETMERIMEKISTYLEKNHK